MGWTGGVQIFDAVVGKVLKSTIPDKDKTAIIETLLDALQDADWDGESESNYFDEPLVAEIFHRKFPDWFDDLSEE